MPDHPSAPPADLLEAGAVAEPLAHNAANEATGGIWRITAPDGGRAVLKVATPNRRGASPQWATSTDERHWNYWCREALAYRSGLAATAYAGIAAPRLREARDLDDGSVALWLEDVDGAAGGSWSMAQFTEFATRLGAGQARWLGEAMPYPWLSRGWLRQYATGRLVPAGVRWDHPVIAAAWPLALRTGLARLARDRDALLAVVDGLPRTLAHLDVWPANLIWSPSGPVLLDWAFVGDGAIGEDIGNLVVDSVADGHVPVDRLPALVDAVTGGYLAGLGGRHDPAVVVRGIRASAAAKYAWFGPQVVDRIAGDRSVGSRFYDAGGTTAERLARWRPMLELLTRWTAEILDP